MWQNGFQVNDGPLRTPDDENSKKFLSELERGVIPLEIKIDMKNRKIPLTRPTGIKLVDRRDTDYVPPPPPAYVAFSSGTALGASTSNSAFIITPEIIASHNIAPTVIDSQPNTTLQFRTIDGRRLRINLNNTATIMDLIAAANSQGVGNDSYILSAGFPPKDLADPNLTLLQADLIGAAILQKKA
jgi:UBX domain-containing protein 1